VDLRHGTVWGGGSTEERKKEHKIKRESILLSRKRKTKTKNAGESSGGKVEKRAHPVVLF